jgi:hypothetical protein
MATQEAPVIWHQVTEKVKQRIVLPGLWRAMEAARALTVDDGLFILAFPPQVSHDAGLLLDSKNLNIIERALEEESGQPLRLKIIQGETLDDWLQQKRRDEEAAAYVRAAQERKRREVGIEQGWDGISERLTRRYAELPLRGLAQTQAAYLEEALDLLTEGVQRLMPPTPSEVDQRALARVIDKVADRAGVPAPLIAFLLRQRTRQG